MQKQFSQYFRNQRRYSVSQNSAERNPLNSSASKKAKFSHGDDSETQKRNFELLRDAKEGATCMSNKTYGIYKSLIKNCKFLNYII